MTTYRLRTTLIFLWFYCTTVIAHLKAAGRRRPALLQRIDAWDKLREQVTLAQTQQRELEVTLIERRATVAVVDLDWDDVVNRLSGTAFLVSGKQVDQDPYATLFGTVKSKDARQLGPAKAATFGKYTVARGEALAHPALAALLDELKTLSDELIEADTSRDAADMALAAFRQTNKALAKSIEQEVAETEIAILTAAPGRRDLVRLVLSPTSHGGQDRTGFRLDQEIVTTDAEADAELEEVGASGLG